jgi:hypothetical protein
LGIRCGHDWGGQLFPTRAWRALFGPQELSRGDLFKKYEVFPVSEELKEVRLREPAVEGGHQFFVQRRDLVACPCCKEIKTARREAKRPLESGRNPRALGSATLLEELRRGSVLPTVIVPGLFLMPHVSVDDGQLLDISLTAKGPVNLPRLVKVDHLGEFKCMCGQRVCRDHDMGILRETALVSD